METLQLDKTETTPQLLFDVNTFEFTMEGECRPENVLTYFNPITQWFNKFRTWVNNLPEPMGKTIQFHFKLEYYNSSSAKFLYSIFEKLKTLQNEGIPVKMFWYYDELDEDLLENGQEFEKILGIPFQYMPQKEA